MNRAQVFSPVAQALSKIDKGNLSQSLRIQLKGLRANCPETRFFTVFFARELTGELQLFADCGLQKDIRKRIMGGYLSFNIAWIQQLNTDVEINRLSISENGNNGRLWRQLHAVFGKHKVKHYSIVTVRCDHHNSIIYVEAGDESPILDYATDANLVGLSEQIYLSILKEAYERTASDWEKAVHELASPLDFIYSNSDFLEFYLTDARVDDWKKQKKLEDFKVVSRLLINRLHQYRFAFAGLRDYRYKEEKVNIYELCKPITHLWYHESSRKDLKFNYDGLRNKPYVYTDKDLLQFIMFNLVSNAIKYSYKGKTIRIYARGRGKDRIRIGIRNTGIPIKEEEREEIFLPGVRGEEASQMDARGMGIGLSVCKQLLSVLSGTMSVGEGGEHSTVFEIELPIRKEER